MSRSLFLAGRLNEVFLDGRWIANTNYKEQLSALSWEEATTKIGNLNTIALLTFHINYYLNGLLKVLKGGSLDISDKYSFDMPPITSEAEWRKLVNELVSNAEYFASMVGRLNDEILDAPFVDKKYGTYWRNIEAILEHSYYHLGQVSLIKKMVLEKKQAPSPAGIH